jgi:hypothetical protein
MRDQGSSERAEDINVDGNDQPNLPSADLAAGLGCNLNYLQGEENVRSSQVWYPPR